MMVYIAGPLTPKDGYTLEDNIEQAAAEYFKFVAAGVPAFCPQLGATLQATFSVDYEIWMRYDFAVIDLCTHVLMLPRWEASFGACREHEYATLKGKDIIYSAEALIGAR